MAGSIFNRLLSSLSAIANLDVGSSGKGSGGGGSLPGSKLTAHFAPLGKADRALPAAVVCYIATGENTSVVLTLQQTAARQAWSGRKRLWPPRDAEALFSDLGKWQVEQMQRFGEVLAALEPLN